jgi:tetratricopeptide (TPR) repeat protein
MERWSATQHYYPFEPKPSKQRNSLPALIPLLIRSLKMTQSAVFSNLDKREVIGQGSGFSVLPWQGLEANKTTFFPGNKDYPREVDLVLFKADLLINAGDYEQVGRLIEPYILAYPDCLPLLLRLGRIDEGNGQYFNAFDLYRQSVPVATSRAEQEELSSALIRSREKLKTVVDFDSCRSLVSIYGNSSPVLFEYDLAELACQEGIMQALISRLDRESVNIFEVGSDSPFLATSLARFGYKVLSAMDSAAAVMKAIGFEYAEMLRTNELLSAQFAHLPVWPEVAEEISPCEIIMLLPRPAWFKKRGRAALNITASLLKQAGRQFFLLLPPAGLLSPAAAESFAADFLKSLQERDPAAAGFEQIYCSPSRGYLYLLDRRSAVKKDLQVSACPPKVMSGDKLPGLITVETNKCLLQPVKTLGFKGQDDLALILTGQAGKSQYSFKDTGAALFLEPAAATKFLQEVKRYRQMKASVKKWGYRPAIFPDGYIEGLFLRKGKDYRFLVTEGVGRLLAAHAGGQEKLTVKLQTRSLCCYSIKDSALWPGVEQGMIGLKQAEGLFKAAFA